MNIKNTALRTVALCLLSSGAPALADTPATCVRSVSTPRLVCDEGACVRVPVKDLCDAVRASYPVKRRALQPMRMDVDPVRNELTLLIASVS